MITCDDYILPTTYNGVKYRSRTEARWAKFFDAAGIKYGYEVEAIKLPSGIYLPDFEIYQYRGAAPIYVEVKGVFSWEEKRKCKELCELTNQIVVMLDGPPDFKCYNIFQWGEEIDCKGTENCDIKNPFILGVPSCSCGTKWLASEKLGILCTASCKYFPIFWYPGFEDKDGYFKPKDWYPAHKDAIEDAQNERFNVFSDPPLVASIDKLP